MFAALSAFRSWAGKRKRLLAGVVGVAVRSASACVPGVGLATELLGQLAEKATEDVFDPESKKPLSQEQLTQLNGWLESLTRSYAALLDRLEQLPLADHGTLEEMTRAVETAIQGRDDLLRAFDGCLHEVRRQTLSLGVLERKLDEHFHVQQNLSAGLEEIKELFVRSPLMGEWATFRRARPEAVEAVVEADEHFLAGRKDQGIAVLMGLLRQRGVGEATLAHQLGLVELSRGDPARAREHLRRATQCGQVAVPSATLAQLATMSGRGIDMWRSLPRGFRVGRKYCIEAEIGRGGMASVYRAERLATFEKGAVAIKVPAPALIRDPATRARFEQEIEVSRRLSRGGHAHIVGVLDYEIFDDPFSGQELYALVMELVEGVSLASYLARRREANKPLKVNEILGVMNAVCAALEHAHDQGVYHRDLKPHNIMVAKGPVVKLMDFGIARVLDDSNESPTRSGQVVGTLAYLPPELLSGRGVVDARTDVYMAGTLLLELLTGYPSGDPSVREDCPAGWVDLIATSTSRMRGQRPASIVEFRAGLKQQALLPASGPMPAAAPPVAAEPSKPPRAAPVEPATAPGMKEHHRGEVLTNKLGMQFAWVPPGESWLGGGGGKPGTKRFTLKQGLWCGVYPVTQAEWQMVMGNNPSHFSGNPRHPVERVSWNDAQDFIARLNQQCSGDGFVYRLPTEDEWEYICRGGPLSQDQSKFDFYFARSRTDLTSNPSNDLSSTQANFDGNHPAGSAAKGPYLQRTSEVGLYLPNPLGIYDLHGNVLEWTSSLEGSARVYRGGCWISLGRDCRAASRDGGGPGLRLDSLGFRLARSSVGQ